MSDISGIANASAAATSPLTARADEVIRGAKAGGTKIENAKIEKSSRDFESILLSSWLQGAQKTFASVPGSDDDDEDSDPGKDQFQGIAMQSLGASMTAAGGIGLAKMISKQLHKAEDTGAAAAGTAKTNVASAK